VFDTNGLVVREAASCATPSLLIKDSCAAEGVEDGVNGFLCEENADSITERLLEVMHDRKLLKEVGLGAQRDIYISWEDAVAKAYERYKIVIENFYKNGEDKKPYQHLQLKPIFKR
jgi:glycosyltransferase involved in cell wall biosynthesis